MPSPNLFPSAPGASGPANGGFGSSTLDGPPPNPLQPTMSDLMGGGGRPRPGQQPLSRDLPPEVLMGLLKAGETVSGMIDDMAAMVPDLAPDLAGSKDLLMRALAKLTLLTGGSQSTLGSSFAGASPLQTGPAGP